MSQDLWSAALDSPTGMALVVRVDGRSGWGRWALGDDGLVLVDRMARSKRRFDDNTRGPLRGIVDLLLPVGFSIGRVWLQHAGPGFLVTGFASPPASIADACFTLARVVG